MGYQSVNPFDNKLVKSFEEITGQQLEAKREIFRRNNLVSINIVI